MQHCPLVLGWMNYKNKYLSSQSIRDGPFLIARCFDIRLEDKAHVYPVESLSCHSL